MTFKLYIRDDFTEIHPGDIITDSRGGRWIFKGFTARRIGPKIYVQDPTGITREFFPSVFPAYEIR